MAKFTNKISNLINTQVPEFVLQEHPKFVEFLKSYYTFMESAEISVTSVEVTDGLRLESEVTTDNSVLLLDASRLDTDRTQLDSGDKLMLEDSTYGKFTRGETITGQTSKATSAILNEDLANGKLYISAQNKFIEGEILVGSNSNAQCILGNYRPNPVNNIQELLDFRDPDKVVSNFLTKFRNEFLNTIPENLDSALNKRNLIKNIKSVYRAKGTSRGHQIFFRMLFGEPSETVYPREQMLRVSDGKWTTNKVLRTIQGVNIAGDTTLLIGRAITGQTSGATALVEAVSKFQIGANEVTEFTLNADTIVGSFVTGEEIRGTESDTASSFIKVTSTGIPGTVTITNDGIYSNENDNVSITGGGQGGLVTVDAVGNGGITEFVIDNAGTGYEIGDELVFANANTSGGGASAAVSLVNGGLQVEGSTEDHIVLEDQTVIGDPYSGNKIVQESGTGNGQITDIRIINPGSNYVKVPTITITSTAGENATVFAHGNEIGKVLGLKVVESGAEYNQSPSPPTLSIPGYMILKDISGSFVADLALSSVDSSSTAISATSGTFDLTRQLLKFSAASGTFQAGREISLSNGATATIAKVDQATATVNVVALADTAGTFVNEDGHISDDAMRIQDSLYYQDFSYVIKVGRVINDWRDSFKKTMHTAGFYFTGQVNIESRISAQISQPVDGIISGIEESPIFGVITQLFSTIFGRRLGTTDDGTTQRANAELGVDPDFDDSTIEHFPQNTRDVTLRRHMTVKLSQTSTLYNISFGGNDYLRGYAWTGMSMGSTKMSSQPFSANNMFSGSHTNVQTSAVNVVDPGQTTHITPMTFVNWADFRFNGLNSTSKDGEVVDFVGLGTDNLRTYIGYPTEILVSVPFTGFDQTDITFDATNVTFDTT